MKHICAVVKPCAEREGGRGLRSPAYAVTGVGMVATQLLDEKRPPVATRFARPVCSMAAVRCATGAPVSSRKRSICSPVKTTAPLLGEVPQKLQPLASAAVPMPANGTGYVTLASLPKRTFFLG